MPEHRVLVAGGGFAGFTCARRLGRMGVDVALVNPEDYFLYTPLLPHVAGGLLDPRDTAVPLARAVPGAHFVRGRVVGVDLAGRTASIDVDGHRRDLAWDRLVLTPGSVTRTFDVPGVRQRAHGLKTVAQAVYLRDHLLRQLERSTSLPQDDERCRALRTVVVVGASYAGTELVAQLRGLADDAARHHGFAPSAVRFLLVDVAGTVMPEVGPRLGSRALEVLRERGVEVRLGTTLAEIRADDRVTLTDGATLPCGTVAWVTGVTASPLVETLGLPLDEGRLVVDDHLRVPGHPHVFAAGDAASVPDLTRPGKVTPPVAQHAVRQGARLARNVAASLGRGESRPYRHRNLGLVVDLGRGEAVATPFGLPLSGRAAKVIAGGYHLAALPGAANRVGVGVDWLLGVAAPRPLVSFGLVDARRASLEQSEALPGR